MKDGMNIKRFLLVILAGFLAGAVLFLVLRPVPPEPDGEPGAEWDLLEIYGADEEATKVEPVMSLAVPADASLEEKLGLLAQAVSRYRFGGLPVNLVGIKDRAGEKVAVIDLRESERNAGVFARRDSILAEGKPAGDWVQDIEGPSWATLYFQGSTGGYITSETLKRTFLQPGREGPWIDAVKFRYRGKPVSPEWDHLRLGSELKVSRRPRVGSSARLCQQVRWAAKAASRSSDMRL
jgi:hypothetical protein